MNAPEDVVPTTEVIKKLDTVLAPPKQEEPGSNLWAILFWSSAALLAADLLAITLISQKIQEEKKRLRRARKNAAKANTQAQKPAQKPAQAPRAAQPLYDTEVTATATQVGTIHQMGRREYQQDSLGHTAVLNNRGLLAVVADGMGGLSGGEKVSQKIVMDTLSLGNQLQPGQVNGALWKILDTVNANVNRTLGPDGLYKSGSTMIAVLVVDGRFQWISVGDSRIYLYRQGYANQLNQDHDQLQVLMADVLSGRRTMEEVLRNPDGRKLTSFLGMGQLKHVDGSHGAIALEPGDRLVLMSDGIYNIIPEGRLADVLKRYPDTEQAASVLDRMIRDSNHPHQDNYTAIILGF